MEFVSDRDCFRPHPPTGLNIAGPTGPSDGGVIGVADAGFAALFFERVGSEEAGVFLVSFF